MGIKSLLQHREKMGLVSLLAPVASLVLLGLFVLYSTTLSGLEGFVAFYMAIFYIACTIAVLCAFGLVLALVALSKSRTRISIAGVIVNLVFVAPPSVYLLKCYHAYLTDPYRIHGAVQSGDVRKVRHLLDKGFDINYSDRDDFTPLSRAAQNNDTEMVKFLMARGARVNDVSYAVGTGNKELVQLLFDNGARVGGLNLAISKADAPMVEFLLAHGADANEVPPHSNGRTVLHHAAIIDADITELLISHGANVRATDEDGRTALHHLAGCYPQHTWASDHREKVTDMLLAAGADLEAKARRGQSPLSCAAELAAASGETDGMRILMDRGADIAGIAEPELRLTVASYAMAGDELKEWFAQNISDVNARDKNGVPILSCAAKAASADAVALLIENGADLNAADAQGDTALHAALRKPRLDVIVLLLEKGADVNAQNNRGQTPLHIPHLPTHIKEKELGEYDLQVFELLLNNHARIDIQDHDGKTALDWYKCWLPSTDNGRKFQQQVIALMEKYR